MKLWRSSGKLGSGLADRSGEDAVQTKTNEVTDALRRTTQLLQTELERSVLSTQMLGEWFSTMCMQTELTTR